MFLYGRNMLWVFAAMQDPPVNFGMQSLDPAIEHFRETGQFGDVFHRDAGISQQLGRAAGGDEFDPQSGEFAGEINQPGFVGDT